MKTPFANREERLRVMYTLAYHWHSGMCGCSRGYRILCRSRRLLKSHLARKWQIEAGVLHEQLDHIIASTADTLAYHDCEQAWSGRL
jgi:hypothetical protein